MREDREGEAAREKDTETVTDNKTFVCGPWAGEFGWEVATWVPVCRHKAAKHKRCVAVVQRGHGDLYEFADQVIEHDIGGQPDRWLCGGKKPKLPAELREIYKDAEVWQPRGDLCYNKPRAWYKYGEYSEALGIEFDQRFDIVIHARAETKYGQNWKNWKRQNWNEYLERFSSKRIACIGSHRGAIALPGCIDYRGVRLGIVCNILAHSKVCVGVNSGPIHLAALCGCPHVTWSTAKGQKSMKGKTNRWRHEVWWNPFRTPVVVIDKYEWQPTTKSVIRATEKLIGCV